MDSNPEHLISSLQKEITKLKEVAKEYNKLKKCLVISNSEYDYDTKTYELTQKLDTSNPIVKQLSVVETKINMIFDHLGLQYNDKPSIVKLKKNVEME